MGADTHGARRRADNGFRVLVPVFNEFVPIPILCDVVRVSAFVNVGWVDGSSRFADVTDIFVVVLCVFLDTQQ